MSAPTTRWELGDQSAYGERFARMIEDGDDVDGEARLADVLAPRHATVLDAGSGMGRVGAALAARGHEVTAVEKDASLVARSRESYSDLPVVVCDLVDLTPDLLGAAGRPTAYDLVVVVGNVMVFVADDTERTVLTNLAALLRPGGRLLAGFRMEGGPQNASSYPEAAFLTDAAHAGLVLEHRFGGYDLRGDDPAYAVWVLRPAAPAPTG